MTEKLQSLLNTILDAPLGLEPAKVHAFVKNGKVESFRGGITSPNHHMILHFTAVLSFIDFAGSEFDLLFVIAQWLHDHEPGHEPGSIQFSMDVLGEGKADIIITAELTQFLRAEPEEAGGVRLKPSAGPNIQTMLAAGMFESAKVQ